MRETGLAVDRTPPAPEALPIDTTTARGRLLAAAAELFATRGVEKPTVEDILRQAGVSRRTFYKHFANRDDVLVALHRALSERFLLVTSMALAQARSTRESIDRTLEIFMMTARRGGALFRVLQGEAMRPGSRLAARRQENFSHLVELHRQAIARAGGEPPDPLFVHGLLAGVEAILQRGAAEGPLDDERMERIRREMSKLMRAGLGSAAFEGVVPSRRGAARRGNER